MGYFARSKFSRRPATLLKKIQHKCFPMKFANFKNAFFYKTPPVTPSALPVAASVFFLKSD